MGYEMGRLVRNVLMYENLKLIRGSLIFFFSKNLLDHTGASIFFEKIKTSQAPPPAYLMYAPIYQIYQNSHCEPGKLGLKSRSKKLL